MAREQDCQLQFRVPSAPERRGICRGFTACGPDENENDNMIETNAIAARINELSGRVASLRRYL